jgi:hypothetical protein
MMHGQQNITQVFYPSTVHVAFIVEATALGHFYVTISGFPTVTFHQCSIFVHWHYITLANDINDKIRNGSILPTAMFETLQASPD